MSDVMGVDIAIEQMKVSQWVDYVQTLHSREIELSLERVREVYLHMYPQGMQCKIISLSGTNGKGSTAELCASIYRQAGYRVGKFTSPHLVNFNERINLNGVPVSDDMLLASFIRIEQSRKEVPITFFEFGTLLAIDIFERADVDVAIMEVGLGGRLDSVNILDADVAITTSVAIDHAAWLGDTVEQIAFEKAGIARTNKPFILGLETPPDTLLKHAKNINADVQTIGHDFTFEIDAQSQCWNWCSSTGVQYLNLPMPFRQAGVQISNCSLAIQAVTQLQSVLPVTQRQLANGISASQLLGRCQIVQQKPLIVFDVSHNEASVKRLAEFIDGQFIKKTDAKCIVVCGMLKDKEIAVSLAQLAPLVDQWHTATIHNERGASSTEVAQEIIGFNERDLLTGLITCHDSVELAYDIALSTLTKDDCLVVFGSFHIVGDILTHIA